MYVHFRLQTNFFYFGRFLKKLADDQCSSVIKAVSTISSICPYSLLPLKWINLKLDNYGSIYYVWYLHIVHFYFVRQINDWLKADICSSGRKFSKPKHVLLPESFVCFFDYSCGLQLKAQRWIDTTCTEICTLNMHASITVLNLLSKPKLLMIMHWVQEE